MAQGDPGSETRNAAPGSVNLPEPTAWPIVFAFGVTLLFTGLVTSESVSILGAILSVMGCVGWFRDVLPVEREVMVRVEEEVPEIAPSRQQVARLPIAPDLPRALLPLETYPVSAGVKGGLAGSVGMAVLACLYGIIRQHSLWYPINLLAATFYSQSLKMGTSALYGFNLDSFLLASMIHVTTSLPVGLLYGAMLPMFPRRPIFLGGFIAPILWTGIVHSILGLVNPLLNQKIDWSWFVASQIAFGVVAGLVVSKQTQVKTRQLLPFALRAGIETPGTMGEKPDAGRP